MFIRGNTQSARDNRERGAAIVEMALVAPLLILLLLGIWTVARAYNVKNTMDHAVREGARFGATIDPWDPADNAENAAAVAAIEGIVGGELGAAAISFGSGSMVESECIELVLEGGASDCQVDGSDAIASAPADQVLVRITVEDYELSFVFFTIDVDFSSQAIARYES